MQERQERSRKSGHSRENEATELAAQSNVTSATEALEIARPAGSRSLTNQEVLRLQRTYGNAYVRRKLAQGSKNRIRRTINKPALDKITMAIEEVPGMPNDYPGAWQALNGLSLEDMRDTLVELRPDGGLDNLLNHFNTAQGVDISRVQSGLLSAIIQGVDPQHPSEETLARLAKALRVPRTGLSAAVMALPAYWRNPIVNAVPTVAAGSVNTEIGENVGGVHYVVENRYDWQLTPTQIRIVVKFKFTGVNNNTVVGQWFNRIRNDWNIFKAVDTADRSKSVEIQFDPQVVGSGEHHSVEIKSGAGRDNEGQWYLGATPGDSESMRMATHEFGHTVGLKDEYQLTHGDYVATVGSAPGQGDTTVAGRPAPADIARELHGALHTGWTQLFSGTERADKSMAIINRYNLQQGDFAQSVATAYQSAYHVGLVADIVDQVPSARQFPIVNPFTFSSSSVMGDQSDHSHPVLARHVRDFVALVQNARGGTWEAQNR